MDAETHFHLAQQAEWQHDEVARRFFTFGMLAALRDEQERDTQDSFEEDAMGVQDDFEEYEEIDDYVDYE